VQRGAELLQHDRLLGEAEARPAVRFRDGQALQAELGARLLPDGPVGLAVVHQLAHPGHRRPIRQETPDRGPKLLLLRTHTQDHCCSLASVITRTSSASTWSPFTHSGLTSSARSDPSSASAASPRAAIAPATASRLAGAVPRAPCSSGSPRSPASIRLTSAASPRGRRRLGAVSTPVHIPAQAHPRTRANAGAPPRPERGAEGAAGQLSAPPGAHRPPPPPAPAGPRQGLDPCPGREPLLAPAPPPPLGADPEDAPADVGFVGDLRRADLQRHRQP